ncbi:MAG: LysR substrate-binding domain-containing protein [Chitinophagaceae bacterium]
MTLTQLEYIVSVDTYRHFANAAARCFISQPTLSMQIQKLEEELGLKIFDRSKQPVVPTEAGTEIIQQARKVLGERDRIQEIVAHKKGVMAGELRVGIIPTLAPYLLPLFVQQFTTTYPQIRLTITEIMTDQVVSRLREGRIDAGILVTPLQENGIREQPLFYEELMAYVSPKNAAFKKTYMLPQDIDPEKLWLLEEGHCFRSQIVNLCELKKASIGNTHFDYEAGSIETLRRMVEIGDGITIIPELATLGMTDSQTRLIRYFQAPPPMREVSLAVHRDQVKKKLIELLKIAITSSLPEKVMKNKGRHVVPVEN